jgi:cysteine desulfurase/selenocysteine lyase
MNSDAALEDNEIKRWRENELSLSTDRIYLDHAAMSPLPKRVEETTAGFHRTRAELGAQFPFWWDRVEQVRSQTSSLIGADSDEITFIPNVSTGINIVAQGIDFQIGDNVIISNLEFPANVYPWLNLNSKGVEVRFLANRNGSLLISDLEKLIDHKTKIVSLSLVQAGNGFKTDIQAVSRLCRENQTLFMIDAIQGLGVHAVDLQQVPCDFLVSGYYKWLFGPDGLAFLYVNQERLAGLGTTFASWAGMKEKFNYTEYQFDLHQSGRRFELGNLNFSAIDGAGKALELVTTIGVEKIHRRVMHLANYIRNQVEGMSGVHSLSDFQVENRSQIVLLHCPNFRVVHANLLKSNIVVNLREGLRVSPHFYNTKEEIDRLIERIKYEVQNVN